MKKEMRLKFYLILISLSLFSCNNRQDSIDNIPNENIPIENINTFIRLNDPKELQNSHINGDALSLSLINERDDAIAFPGDFGVKIYTFIDGVWTDVFNNFGYPDQEQYLPTAKDYPLGQIVDCAPYFENLSSPIVIRVVVVGSIEEQPDKPVAAFVDITITP